MKRILFFTAALMMLAACNRDNGTPDDNTKKDFVEKDGSFVYFGETYKTVKLADGTVWMAEPLRYIPEGLKPSDNPEDDAAHIWYPYTIKDGKAVAATDKESIAKYGYFYDIQGAFGKEVTEDNCGSFEGQRGICPEGWHIPTRAEFIALVGSSSKAVGEDAAPTDEKALFYNAEYKGAKISDLNKAGWNVVLGGVRMKGTFAAKGMYSAKPVISETNCSVADYYGNPGLNYVMSSTCYKPLYNKDKKLTNIQFFGMMSAFTLTAYPEGRLTTAYISSASGQQIRCVKDRKI